MFKWAVSEEMVPSSVYEALADSQWASASAVPMHARSEPAWPVADETIKATLAFLPPIVADMKVRLQRITGMRSDNLAMLRPCDFTRSDRGSVVYEPQRHKTLHHQEEIVYSHGSAEPKNSGVVFIELFPPCRLLLLAG